MAKHRNEYIRKANTGLPGDKLSHKQRLFAETYYANGFNKVEAYLTAYGDHRGLKSPVHVRAHVIFNSIGVTKYLKWLGKNQAIKFGVDRHFLIKGLLDIISNFQDMHDLASKDTLTKKEEAKFKRLSSLTKTADLNRTQDMLARLLGAYEPEQVNHNITYQASFGDPIQLDNNAEDIDFEDIKEEDDDE